MDLTVAKKRCSRCKHPLPLEAFALRMTRGVRVPRSRCKLCELAEGRAFEKRPEVREKRAEYRRSPERKEARDRYYASGKAQIQLARTRARYPERCAAREALNRAVRAGKITKGRCAATDESCSGRIEGHHHNGYDREHWLDVEWLCRAHHVLTHSPQSS